MHPKQILLINYTFPPAPGIGGRRWAKFAKYLSAQGYTVHVVTSQNLSGEISKWYKDVQNNDHIKIHAFKFSFQQLLTKPRNIPEKLIRKIFIYLCRLTKYTQTFLTSFPNKHIWNAIEQLIKSENITDVVVSGDPFLFYHASQLKKKNNFNLTLDYRDLWNDHSFYSKFIDLTGKQKKYFEFVENTAINNCDKVVTVDDHLKKVLTKRLANKNSEKIQVIHNGFDPDDFKTELPFSKTNSETIKLYFAGNIASDLNEIVLHFIKSFSELKRLDPDLYLKTEIYISGLLDRSLVKSLVQLNLENLHLSTTSVSIKEYLAQLQKADAGIVILSEEYANSFITKSTDYLYLKKYILALGYPGDFSNFLTKHNCGMIFTLKDDYTFFNILHKKVKTPVTLNEPLINFFNLKNLTQQYIRVLKD